MAVKIPSLCLCLQLEISKKLTRVLEYVISMPNMYARGILWGKMVLELGDSCTARNERSGLCAELQFKTKGYFSGTYNAISGKVKKNNSDVGEISGKWSSVMDYKTSKVCVVSGGVFSGVTDVCEDRRGGCCLM